MGSGVLGFGSQWFQSEDSGLRTLLGGGLQGFATDTLKSSGFLSKKATEPARRLGPYYGGLS